MQGPEGTCLKTAVSELKCALCVGQEQGLPVHDTPLNHLLKPVERTIHLPTPLDIGSEARHLNPVTD